MRNDMLELKNVSFQVAEDRGDKEIIRGVSLAVPESKLVVITRGRTSPKRASPTGRGWASPTPFSSRSGSRASRCWT